MNTVTTKKASELTAFLNQLAADGNRWSQSSPQDLKPKTFCVEYVELTCSPPIIESHVFVPDNTGMSHYVFRDGVYIVREWYKHGLEPKLVRK